MRDLKLRVIQNNKILGYVETDPTFNSGCFFQLDNALSDEERFLECNPGFGILFPSFRNQESLSSLTYEQYTGLKDKNGKEIYEGDILVVGDSPKYTVTWETDRWKMCGKKDGNGFSIYIPGYIEIIGNIHDTI